MGQSGGEFKLFGVQIAIDTVGSIKKSSSTSNISLPLVPTHFQIRSGYASDDPNCSNPHTERKKGIPWTVEEHRKFLVGLKECGKGDWRGISRDYVITRTPLQVASHAQKYFVHQTNASRRKRTSLFDITDPEMHIDQLVPVKYEQLQLPQGEGPELSGNPIPQGPKEAVPDNTKILLPPVPVPYPVAIPVHCSFCCPPPPAFPVLRKEPRNVNKGTRVSQMSIGEDQ